MDGLHENGRQTVLERSRSLRTKTPFVPSSRWIVLFEHGGSAFRERPEACEWPPIPGDVAAHPYSFSLDFFSFYACFCLPRLNQRSVHCKRSMKQRPSSTASSQVRTLHILLLYFHMPSRSSQKPTVRPQKLSFFSSPPVALPFCPTRLLCHLIYSFHRLDQPEPINVVNVTALGYEIVPQDSAVSLQSVLFFLARRFDTPNSIDILFYNASMNNVSVLYQNTPLHADPFTGRFMAPFAISQREFRTSLSLIYAATSDDNSNDCKLRSFDPLSLEDSPISLHANCSTVAWLTVFQSDIYFVSRSNGVEALRVANSSLDSALELPGILHDSIYCVQASDSGVVYATYDKILQRGAIHSTSAGAGNIPAVMPLNDLYHRYRRPFYISSDGKWMFANTNSTGGVLELFTAGSATSISNDLPYAGVIVDFYDNEDSTRFALVVCSTAESNNCSVVTGDYSRSYVFQLPYNPQSLAFQYGGLLLMFGVDHSAGQFELVLNYASTSAVQPQQVFPSCGELPSSAPFKLFQSSSYRNSGQRVMMAYVQKGKWFTFAGFGTNLCGFSTSSPAPLHPFHPLSRHIFWAAPLLSSLLDCRTRFRGTSGRIRALRVPRSAGSLSTQLTRCVDQSCRGAATMQSLKTRRETRVCFSPSLSTPPMIHSPSLFLEAGLP